MSVGGAYSNALAQGQGQNTASQQNLNTTNQTQQQGGQTQQQGGQTQQQTNQQKQQSPLPAPDYSAGYARTFQQPSFYNPFQGYYGSGTPYGSGSGGFASQGNSFGGGFNQMMGGGGFNQMMGGGFNPMMGGIGGFGGMGGFNPMMGGFGGFGGMGGFNPMMGGIGGFGGGFGYQQPYQPYGRSRQQGLGNSYTGQNPSQPFVPAAIPSPQIEPYAGYQNQFGGNQQPSQPSSSGRQMPRQAPLGQVENPYYKDRFSDGSFQTMDIKFSDRDYITSDELDNYQKQMGNYPIQPSGGMGDYPMQPYTPEGRFVQTPAGYPEGYAPSPIAAQPQAASRFNPSDPYQVQAQDAQRRAQEQASQLTDYQRLMRLKNAPPTNATFGGLKPVVRQPTDQEIAQSLGFKDFDYDLSDSINPARNKIIQENNAKKAKEYLNKIGYGQAGFDSSKYEVRKQPSAPVSLSSLGLGLAQVNPQPIVMQPAPQPNYSYSDPSRFQPIYYPDPDPIRISHEYDSRPRF